MKKVIAVEESLFGNIKEAVENQGYTVVKPENAVGVDALVISGMDDNVMGMQDIAVGAPVIDASGKTAGQVLHELEKRLG